MAAATEAFGVTVKADFRDFEKALLKASNQTDTKLAAMERRFTAANSNVRKQTGGLAQAARSGLADLTSSISSAGAGLPGLGAGMGNLGIAGAGAAVGVGALVVALQGVKDAAKFAADLSDSADRIGVGVEALQELRYAADETGVDIAKLEGGLEALNGSLGAFVTGIGAGKVTKVFERLGLTKEALASVDNATELLPILADKISQIGDRAEQVQIARKLGIEPLLPMLRRGSAGLNDMARESRDLGLVLSGDVVKGLDETDRALERNKQQIDANVRSMQASLAPFFVWVTNSFATLTRAVGDFINSMDRAENRQGRVLADQSARLQGMVTRAYQQAPRQPGGRLTQVQQGWVRRLAEVNAEIARRARSSISSAGPSAADRTREIGDAPNAPTRSGGRGSRSGSTGRAQAETDRAAADALARARRFDDQMASAQRDTLQAQSQLATTAQQRASIAILLLDQERQSRLMDLERQVTDGQISEADKQRLIEAERGVWLAREANIAQTLNQSEIERARAQLIDALNKDRAANEAARAVAEEAKANFRNEFVSGMRAALDGELGGYFENLADRFANRLLENLADDLFSLLDRQGNGNTASGLGKVASSIFGGFKLPGFKTGGSFKVGGSGGLDSQTVAFRATPGEMVDIRKPGQATGGGALAVHVTPSPYFDVAVERVADPAAARAGVQSFNASRSQVPTDLARKQTYRTR
ncbi:hypothetical protein [Brevundimonas subvibrioides]|uniref:hypothetical protein n=1 Tax=Brevundimonas subvibrioides TaxID=74313 RepID=UPI0022B41CF7|nr:hypothetical protein [Brevundimonas subvibrioides]